MRAELLDPRTDERWREFVGRAPGATIFHHPAWHDLLAAHYGHAFEACCLLDERGRIAAGLPWARVESRLTGRRLVALPFSDACAPLLDGAPEEALGRALDAERRNRELGLEARWRIEGLEGAAPHRFWRHVLQLEPDPAAVERRARGAARRGAAKARREGLAFEMRTDAHALDSFYRLHVRTRRRQGAPTQAKRFIARLSRLFEDGHGFVALVGDETRRPIAAAVFLRLGGHLTYKYGASDRASLPRRPNNLLFAEVIRWACESGCRELDFGRTDLDNEGLRDFKRGWGAEESALHYTYAGLPEPGGPSLPQRVVATTIRHTPPVVGRAIGAAMYRHFA
jgi:CelD/BcsL family acetyltransferase involved in cellulose biosynthesis